MIKVNGTIIAQNHFPDGTLHLTYKRNNPSFGIMPANNNSLITWCYDSDDELFTIICLVNHIRELEPDGKILLQMPYLPNARFDRIEQSTDIFTLKYFCKIINSLNIDSIEILNPHSNVSTALLDRVVALPTLAPRIANGFPNALLFFPDEGAAKRYAQTFQRPYAAGCKERDWATGAITNYYVASGLELIEDKDILIVDDICSRGGTFLHAAETLHALGAKDIYLYVDHCENTILDGDMINSNLIKKIYTTDSIFTKSHDKVEIIYNFRREGL